MASYPHIYQEFLVRQGVDRHDRLLNMVKLRVYPPPRMGKSTCLFESETHVPWVERHHVRFGIELHQIIR